MASCVEARSDDYDISSSGVSRSGINSTYPIIITTVVFVSASQMNLFRLDYFPLAELEPNPTFEGLQFT